VVEVKNQLEQKVSENPSQPIIWAWWCMPVTPAMQEAVYGPGQPKQKHEIQFKKSLKQKGLGK
jgi:hypothetical protein